MRRDITSKNLDGITDLVVMAPIREGFIKAYENVTYATRLQIAAEALHRIRQSAREHEYALPFSDTTERILTLLDFRVGVLDQDLFKLDLQHGLKARRYLYLTATFDGAWEPYMRLIWKPLGPFLDLLFCNCEGYVTAGDHDFPQYAQWVRDHQLDSSIFYSTTGLTVKDQLYLSRLDQISRESGEPLEMVRMVMPNPEEAAAELRRKALEANEGGDGKPLFRIHELALEALTVLFKLADYYPPEWLIKTDSGALRNEGVYLARVAESLLDGWPSEKLTDAARAVYREPLEWYQSALTPDASHRRPIDSRMATHSDPDFASQKSQVQGGLIRPQGSREQPVRFGALLLMTVSETAAARRFIAGLDLHFEEGPGSEVADGMYRTLALTAEGLERLGMEPGTLQQFPKEFREGMATRSGLIGDVRENHPRRWSLPERNWPKPGADEAPRPPVEMGEVDFVIQLRYAPESAMEDGEAVIRAEIERIAARAEASGAVLVAEVPMFSKYETDAEGTPLLRDPFGFREGISQPETLEAPVESVPDPQRQVRLGELLCGYRNDRGDFATPPEYFEHPPGSPTGGDDQGWRRDRQKDAARFQLNGSFLVLRKLQQHPETFRACMQREASRISEELEVDLTPGQLAARLLGREPDGAPLIGGARGANGFDYRGDKTGSQCPFAAHIRRVNPRTTVHGRPTPRIVRRGMSYRDAATGECGLIFQCYNASIAEQYEVIQRWINGGNSTDVSAAQNDPLMGVGPRTGDRHFRFEWEGKVARVRMPDPFVSLHWGLYLFVPSRAAIARMCAWQRRFNDLDEALENRGRDRIRLVEALPDDQRSLEWKRLLEDFYAKDPAEMNEMPNVWSAIRWYGGGSLRVDSGVANPGTEKGGETPPPSVPRAPTEPVEAGTPREPTVLVGTVDHALQILTDWRTFSVEEQLSRIVQTSGSIYVTQQPDDAYDDETLKKVSNYRKESEATNAILLGYSEESGFDTGYEAGKAILDGARARAAALGLDYFKLELRRQYLMPALGRVCTDWFGLPDGEIMKNGGWNWNQATDAADPEGPSKRPAQCPGDCLSPSRDAFYPNPTATISMFAHDHGPAIRKAGQTFVDTYVKEGIRPAGSFAGAMFDLPPDQKLTDEGYARNLIGIMVGAMPPMDGNLRGILLEWVNEKTLWRHQGAYFRALPKPGGTGSRYAAAKATLYSPMVHGMCKRPAPDLIYRKARRNATLAAGPGSVGVGAKDVHVKKGDKVVVSLVSVAQRALRNHDLNDEAKVSIVFGGVRTKAWQGEYDPNGKLVDPELPVHACPAQNLAMGAMMGILAALLEAGEIKALPASLILEIRALGKAAPAASEGQPS